MILHLLSMLTLMSKLEDIQCLQLSTMSKERWTFQPIGRQIKNLCRWKVLHVELCQLILAQIQMGNARKRTAQYDGLNRIVR